MVSVQSLLCEVTPLFSSQYTLKAADELFFGDKMLYHYCSNDESQREKPGQNHCFKDEQSTSLESEHRDTPIHSDGLRSAIVDAKKTLKQALEDDGNDDASALLNEVAALKKMSDEMRLELANLSRDFQKLLQYVQQVGIPQLFKARYHLQSRTYLFLQLPRIGRKILILGDGDLSFSLEFARLYTEVEIHATVFETYIDYLKKYPSAQENIKKLRTYHPRVKVSFSIDACSLSLEWTGIYDDIIWNFPHHCGKTNIRKSRNLMRKTFVSIERILSGGRFHLTLAKGQSGLNPIAVILNRCLCYSQLPKHRADSWKIIYIAAEQHLILEEVSIFQREHFPSYVSSGYRNSERSFHMECGAETLVFRIALAVTKLDELHNLEKEVLKLKGAAHEFRPFFKRDLSVLYLNSDKVLELEKILFSLIEELCGFCLIGFNEVICLRTTYLGKPNRIYRLVWQSWSIPLSRNLCNVFHEEMKLMLINRFLEKHLEMTNNNVRFDEWKEKPSEEVQEQVDASKSEDFDLFGSSDEEDEEKQRIREERLKAYAKNKAKKPEGIAKSSIIMDIKPWDDTTNMEDMEKLVRSIEKDGLVWGGAKLVPLAYGIKVLQIICVVEDEKVSVDNLIEQIIEEIPDHVQSVDIVAFNKI
ncbi:unnamed protein product [Thelazia callipaeda]|uniref:DUF2431 domain-containing protein n=1 Tax=Thelazia callipaeda TaxID=103827 RepID=A0A0N5CV32_THECL|nr:unnamed protein product [Thelazia callipaeda]